MNLLPGSQFAFSEGDVHVYKLADEVISSSNILHSDLHLFTSLRVQLTYILDIQLLLNSVVASSDWKFGFLVPSGTTMFWGPHGGVANFFDPAGVGGSADALLTELSTLGVGNAAGRTIGVAFRGAVYTSTTPGVFRLQWAQNTSQSGLSTVKKGSMLRVHPM